MLTAIAAVAAALAGPSPDLAYEHGLDIWVGSTNLTRTPKVREYSLA